MSAICAVVTVETVWDDFFALLRLILSVKNETSTRGAVEVYRVENVSVEAGVTFVGSDTGFTLGHVAVSAVEKLCSGIVINVLTFRTFIEALDLF